MKLDIVQIEWLDSETGMGWQSIDADDKPHRVVSVGILASESNEMVTLSTSFDPENDEWNPVISIPRCSIVKRKRLCQIQMKLS